MPTILLSAPYMIPFLDRFRPLFEHYQIDLIVQPCMSAWKRKNCCRMPGRWTAQSAEMTVFQRGCWPVLPRA